MTLYRAKQQGDRRIVPARWRRRCGWLLVTGGLSLVFASRVQAQDTTSVAEDILETLSPSYTTRYTLERLTTDWGQDFKFGTSFGFMNFTNKTNFDVSTDDGRNEERRNGSNQTDLRWLLIKKFPITTSLRLGKNSIVRPGDEIERNNAAVNLNGSHTVNALGIRNTFKVGTGYNRDTNVSVISDKRSKRQDTGFSRDASWRGSVKLNRWTVNGSFNDRGSSRTSTLETVEEKKSTPTSQQNQAITLNVDYAPTEWAKTTVALSDNTSSNETFLPREAKLEKQINDSRSVRATVNLTPMTGTSLVWNASANDRNLSYKERVENASRGSGLSWDGRLTTAVLGVKLESNLKSTEDSLEPATSADFETHSNIFDGKLSRSISRKISLKFNWLVRATQYFYSDPVPTNILDRDELRTKLQPGLTYTPSEKWTVTASYIRSTSRRVELNESRAAQTKDDEDFSVDFYIIYNLSDKTNLSQSYSIKALFTTFDFNPRSNRLLETQRITTNLTSRLTPKVNLDLEHRFTLQDSGPFAFAEDGSRVFFRNLRKYRQELTTDIRYQISSWFSVFANSRFLRTDNVNLATDARIAFRELNLKQGFDINHTLVRGMTFRATGQYHRSNQRESYWSLVSTLNKEF